MVPGSDHVDVLIIGAGPAGLMATTWMARMGVKTRIVDKRGTKIFNGQADGLQCRSLEIFDSFGFADRVWKESNHMLEICMWNPGEDGAIRRSDRIPDTLPGLSRFTEVVLHQGRIERFFLDHIKKYSDIAVERDVLPEILEYDASRAESNEGYPITVQLRHLSEDEATPQQNLTSIPDGLFRSSLAKDDTDDLLRHSHSKAGATETVKAKYLIGCDGAHSWTRWQLGFALEGEMTDFIWGVLDIIPITNFPDIRCRCAIHSSSSGSLMVIPRENKLVRLYIQLTEVATDASGRADRSKISPGTIIKAAQKILAPYTLTYQYCDWWTAYQIGQRVGTHFSKDNRIFLAGDSVHTHSPKAGQGMNVSMQDTFNLGWKLGLVVKGMAPRGILETYETERKKNAHDLIEFDHKFSRLFSGRPAKDAADEAGVSMKEFKEAFEKGALFTSGVGVEYEGSVLVARPGAENGTDSSNAQLDGAETSTISSKPTLAPGVPLGRRLPSHKILNQSDARPWHLAELLKSDGHFRVLIFAGDITAPSQKRRLESFVDALDGPVRRVTPPDAPVNAVIQILTIHASPRAAVDIFSFPELLRPFDDQRGWDYDAIFADDMSYHEGHGEIYKNLGIDRERGCVVIARPDQHVAYVGALEDASDVGRYFEGVLLPVRMQRADAVRKVERLPVVHGGEEGNDATARTVGEADGDVM